MLLKIVLLLTISCSLLAHEHDIEEALNHAVGEDKLLIEELKKAFENGAYVPDVSHDAVFPKELPEWAEGSHENANQYYKLHAESYLDRTLSEIVCRLGIIIHGSMNQEQLEKHLTSFDIAKLQASGPYENSTLSLAAQQLILESIQLPSIYDIHLHNLGYDEDNYLNPVAGAQGIAKWSDYFTFMVLRYAAGMKNPVGSTQEARKRIQLYAQHFPKFCGIVLPIHQAFSSDGTVDWQNTGNYLSDKAALKTAKTFSSKDASMLAAISIHPFDPQWQAKMVKAHAQGIRLIKWMPPQSIPPDSVLVENYYAQMKALGMTLIAHAGPEHVIPTNEENKDWADYGNPLRFRKPLEMGVNVILAHCGHKDLIPDLDHPEKPLIPGYQLFFRLAREAHKKNQSGEWSGKLYGDLAGVLSHYGTEFIRELLMRANEEGIRLIYGSDYPYTNLIKPNHDAYDECCAANLLDSWKVEPLKEIRNWNPLLANYVFARNLQLQTEGGLKTFPERTFSGKVF